GVTFYFQRKLPYKKMLVVTGVLIGFVLVVMVGQTVRTMQGTGWVPITPVDITPPSWPGLCAGGRGRADRVRAGGDGRPDGPHDAGHRLGPDHAGRHHAAVLVRTLVRR